MDMYLILLYVSTLSRIYKRYSLGSSTVVCIADYYTNLQSYQTNGKENIAVAIEPLLLYQPTKVNIKLLSEGELQNCEYKIITYTMFCP